MSSCWFNTKIAPCFVIKTDMLYSACNFTVVLDLKARIWVKIGNIYFTTLYHIDIYEPK